MRDGEGVREREIRVDRGIFKEGVMERRVRDKS